MKSIFKNRIISWVKEYQQIEKFGTEAKEIFQILQHQVLALTSEIQEIMDDDDFKPNEKMILVNDRLLKTEEITIKIDKLILETKDKFDLINKEREILIETISENEKLLRSDVLIEIKKELDKK